MSKLYYKIVLAEVNENSINCRRYEKNIPHFEEIKAWLPKLWDECHIEKTFSLKEIRENVASCTMKVEEHPSGSGETYALVTIEFKPGFRLSERRRQSVWDDLNAQMTDGYGEYIDHCQIPNAPEGFVLEI